MKLVLSLVVPCFLVTPALASNIKIYDKPTKEVGINRHKLPASPGAKHKERKSKKWEKTKDIDMSTHRKKDTKAEATKF